MQHEPIKHEKVPKGTKPAVKAQPSPAANYLLISAGSIFTSMLLAGFIVGYILDQLFDTTPLFFLSCAVLGFIGGIQKVHALTKRLDHVNVDMAEETKDDQKSG